MAQRLMPWFWAALPVLFASGLIFVLARPGRYFSNPIFGIKMLLLLAATVTAAYIQRRARAEAALTVSTKLLAGVSVLLWLTIVLAGRWIAYVDYLLPPE